MNNNQTNNTVINWYKLADQRVLSCALVLLWEVSEIIMSPLVMVSILLISKSNRSIKLWTSTILLLIVLPSNLLGLLFSALMDKYWPMIPRLGKILILIGFKGLFLDHPSITKRIWFIFMLWIARTEFNSI